MSNDNFQPVVAVGHEEGGKNSEVGLMLSLFMLLKRAAVVGILAFAMCDCSVIVASNSLVIMNGIICFLCCISLLFILINSRYYVNSDSTDSSTKLSSRLDKGKILNAIAYFLIFLSSGIRLFELITSTFCLNFYFSCFFVAGFLVLSIGQFINCCNVKKAIDIFMTIVISFFVFSALVRPVIYGVNILVSDKIVFLAISIFAASVWMINLIVSYIKVKSEKGNNLDYSGPNDRMLSPPPNFRLVVYV